MRANKMVVWSEIDTVLLDMDGTLLDLHFDNYFWQHHLPQAYARKRAMTLVDAEHIVFSQFSHAHGTLKWYCLDYWADLLDLDIVALKKEVQHLIAIRPGAKPFLEFLRANGKRSVLITNAHRDSLQLKMAKTGIDELLDRLISSHDFGYPKEDPAFWHALATTETFIPVRTLFIDDTPAILDAARKFGIANCLGVHRPDSKGEPKPDGAHRLLREFSDLWA